MKSYTKQAIGTFQKLTDKKINGIMYGSWRTPDNKHFYLTPTTINLNKPQYGINPEHYEITYTLLGLLDFIK